MTAQGIILEITWELLLKQFTALFSPFVWVNGERRVGRVVQLLRLSMTFGGRSSARESGNANKEKKLSPYFKCFKSQTPSPEATGNKNSNYEEINGKTMQIV